MKSFFCCACLFTLRLTCKCVYLCVYVFNQFRDQRTMSGLEGWGMGEVVVVADVGNNAVDEVQGAVVLGRGRGGGWGGGGGGLMLGIML